uniref:Uncharacterized protein n=1 Tax=Parastrongyloides trichosuri TaxID=131310 RepID=A0A0N4ZJ95_PARTI
MLLLCYSILFLLLQITVVTYACGGDKKTEIQDSEDDFDGKRKKRLKKGVPFYAERSKAASFLITSKEVGKKLSLPKSRKSIELKEPASEAKKFPSSVELHTAPTLEGDTIKENTNTQKGNNFEKQLLLLGSLDDANIDIVKEHLLDDTQISRKVNKTEVTAQEGAVISETPTISSQKSQLSTH